MFDDMNPDATVDFARLSRLRRNHQLVFCIVGLSAVLWIGGGLVTLLLPEQMKPVARITSAIGFANLALMIGFRFFFKKTRCPRCGKPFYTSEGGAGFFQKMNYLTRRCVHCGQSMNVEP